MIRPAVAALAIAAAVTVAAGRAGAADAAAAVAERERALAALRAEAETLEARLGDISRRVESISDEVDRLGLELALQERRTAEARAARDLAADHLARAEREASELENRLAVTRRRFRDSAFDLYRRGRRSTVAVALSVLQPAEPAAAMRWLRFAAARDARLAQDLDQAVTALAERRSRIAAEKSAAARWYEEEARRRREIARLHSRQAALLDRFLGEHRSAGSRSVDLRDRERRLETLLAVISSTDGAREMVGRPIQEFRGVLDWPAAGRVAAGFGPRLDPRYRTKVPHAGVDLALGSGATVRTVYPGEVVYAGAFEGYGNLVVVRHAGRVLTLYAGLANLRVARHDVVAFNAVVGQSGESLYFELRADGRAEDPLIWLRETLPEP